MSRKYEYAAVPHITAFRCQRETHGANKQLSICPGELKSDGHNRVVRGEGTFEYRHRCTDCGQYEWLRDTYPQVRYERIPDQPPAG